MKQLNIAMDDKLFLKWKGISDKRGADLVPLVRSMLQTLSSDLEPVTLTVQEKEVSCQAEVLSYRGDRYSFWFGSIYLEKKMPQDLLLALEEDWKLTRKNGEGGTIKVCNVTMAPGSDTILDFSGISILHRL